MTLIVVLAMWLPAVSAWAAPRDMPMDMEEPPARQSLWVEAVEELVELVEWVQSMWGGVDPGPGLDPFLRAETREEPEQAED
ncbi:MAG: hypothetical protein AAF481_02905 [Acidobacteriota bacterium]